MTSKRINGGKKVDIDFTYSSDRNVDWMDISDLKLWIETNYAEIGKL